MTLTIELPGETEAQLCEKASREGQDAVALAVALLVEALRRDAREWAEAVAAIGEGLADSAAGRTTPLREWDVRVRAKHGIPADASAACPE